MDGSWSFGPAAIAAFIVFIGVLIFVHELGHFLAAKYFDIKVLKFSLGFGPPLVAFKKGETQYQIAAVPLGGFVKMVGDNPVDDVSPEDKARSFNGAPIYQRAIIALAGPAFNLVFPVICFFAYSLLGPIEAAPVVGQVELGTPAERAGLKTGDRVLTVDGERAWSFQRMAKLIESRPGQPLVLEVRRGDEQLELTVIPREVPREDVFGAPEKHGQIGVSSTRAGTRIGVDDPARNTGGLRTGDRILSIDGAPVRYAEEVEARIRAVAGRTVEVVVARPEELASGDLLIASPETPVKLQVPVPAGAEGIDALGLASADTFVRALVPGGAAERAGLREGDRITAVNGQPIRLFQSFNAALQHSRGEAVVATVRRDGVERTIDLVPDKIVRKHEVTGMDRADFDFGIGAGVAKNANLSAANWSTALLGEAEQVELSIGEAAKESVRRTWEIISLVTLGLVKLFSRDISLDTVGGPVMLFQVAAQAAELGLGYYLQMLAVISVNLGLINLLPIPIFDGGHLVFCAVEAVKRRPVSLRARELASIIGLVLIIALFVLAMRNDLLRLDLF
ncbi:RIP metalloprotease RseP [Myxococcota bacterium]|nr:RIP metalloprotease RseP [Myxococcota bacterium]